MNSLEPIELTSVSIKRNMFNASVVAIGMSVSITLTKQDEKNIKGSVMGMIPAKGTREK